MTRSCAMSRPPGNVRGLESPGQEDPTIPPELVPDQAGPASNFHPKLRGWRVAAGDRYDLAQSLCQVGGNPVRLAFRLPCTAGVNEPRREVTGRRARTLAQTRSVTMTVQAHSSEALRAQLA